MRRSLPQLVLAALLLGVPAAGVALAHVSGRFDAEIIAPEGHFYIVSVVALVSALLALVAAITALRSVNVRLLLVALAFVGMAGMFAVHGLATPGFLVQQEYFAVTGFSARMALVLASMFLAASAVEPPRRVEQALVRGRYLVLAGSVALLLGYAVAALRFPVAIPPRLVSEQLFLRTTLGLVLALTLFSGAAYFQSYRRSGLPIFGAVALGSGLIFEAQLVMHFGEVWYASWWVYHLQLLSAFGAIAWALFAEYTRGGSVLLTMEGLALRDPVAQIEAGYTEAINALAAALEARDGYTHGHGKRVAALAVLIGEQLGLGPGRIRALAQGALLHDIGKIAVPDHILNKPTQLSPREFEVIKEHPERGEAMLAAAFRGRTERAVIRHHHERFDGTGYPDGLVAEAIPLEARIAAVADVYDALRSTRAYRTAWDSETTLAYMREQARTHFDPACLEAFLAIVDRWEAEFSADAEQTVRVLRAVA